MRVILRSREFEFLSPQSDDRFLRQSDWLGPSQPSDPTDDIRCASELTFFIFFLNLYRIFLYIRLEELNSLKLIIMRQIVPF